MKNTLIATATYNEAENIKELIPKIKKTNKSLDILIVDEIHLMVQRKL